MSYSRVQIELRLDDKIFRRPFAAILPTCADGGFPQILPERLPKFAPAGDTL